MTTKMGNIFELNDIENPGRKRNEENLKSAFPRSPQYIDNDEHVRAHFNVEVLRGEVSNGLGFNNFDRDFVDAPDIDPKLVAVPSKGGSIALAPSISSDLENPVAAIRPSSTVFAEAKGLQNPIKTSAQRRLTVGAHLAD